LIRVDTGSREENASNKEALARVGGVSGSLTLARRRGDNGTQPAAPAIHQIKTTVRIAFLAVRVR
jgi:hypothetical protein